MWKLLIDLIKSGKFILPVADVETASFVNLQATGVEQITDSDNRYGTSELHIHLALKFNLFKKKNVCLSGPTQKLQSQKAQSKVQIGQEPPAAQDHDRRLCQTMQ